ncbi:hypothetical protein C0993_007455 [Termitomyces sp. T159_Od127]|nr:hypothetical protein C0993_007455 [Termitomyces sp. T159_Od127]
MYRFLKRLTPAAQLRWGAAYTHAPRRFMSKGTLDPMTGELTALPDINISALEVIPNAKPSTPPPSSTLVFGHTFLFDIRVELSSADAPLSLEPSSTVLHYAQTIFEGMKAYRQEDGKVTLFRPDMNMKRMNNSAQRIALPVRIASLSVYRAPVGPYYPKGFKPVALYGTTEYIRAAPGGTGAFKLGVNYAPGVMPQKEAAAKGYVQNLWLHGPDHHLTEVWLKKENGGMELVTPPLDGMILPGVTRDSVLALARDHISGKNPLPKLPDDLTVSERPVTMKEVKEASETGALVELFGAGTAAVISPVDRIGYLGEDVHIPTGEDGMGPVSRPIWTELVGRQTGTIPSEWSVEVTK